MNPSEGLFSAAKEREEQLKEREAQAAAEAASSASANITTGLFSAAAERALGGLPEAKRVAEPLTVTERNLEREKRLSQNRRPWPVTLIALYRFFNAAVILIPLALLLLLPQDAWGNNTLIRLIFFRARGSASPLLVLPALYAAYSIVVAWGLWTRHKWARNVVMGGAAAALMYGIRYIVMVGFWFGTYLFPGAELVYMGMLFEVLILLVMKSYPDVREFFRVDILEK